MVLVLCNADIDFPLPPFYPGFVRSVESSVERSKQCQSGRSQVWAARSLQGTHIETNTTLHTLIQCCVFCIGQITLPSSHIRKFWTINFLFHQSTFLVTQTHKLLIIKCCLDFLKFEKNILYSVKLSFLGEVEGGCNF